MNQDKISIFVLLMIIAGLLFYIFGTDQNLQIYNIINPIKGDPYAIVSKDDPIQKPAGVCRKGYGFSQKTCGCVRDANGCIGLNEEACKNNAKCEPYYPMQEGAGTCGTMEIAIHYQCLPKN